MIRTTGISEFADSGGNTFGGQFPGDYKIPYSMQFNIGFQRELAKNHVISVDLRPDQRRWSPLHARR